MYYEPGSVMAKVRLQARSQPCQHRAHAVQLGQCCVDGARKMYEYCEARDLPCKRCGKLIVAATENEFHWVKTLKERGDANGVQDLEIVYSDRIQELEPHVRGYAALYSPNTGIVDYALVARSFAQDLVDSKRGTVKLKFEVTDFKLENGRVAVSGVEPGQKGPVRTVTGKHVITCAGLHADRVAEKGGGTSNPKVVRQPILALLDSWLMLGIGAGTVSRHLLAAQARVQRPRQDEHIPCAVWRRHPCGRLVPLVPLGIPALTLCLLPPCSALHPHRERSSRPLHHCRARRVLGV